MRSKPAPQEQPPKPGASLTPLLRLALPECRQTRQVLLVSLCITGAVFLWFAKLRLSPTDPHAVGIFRYLVREQDFFTAIPFAIVLLLALSGRVQRTGRTFAVWSARNSAIVAAVTTVLLAVGARFIYHAHPLSMDEYAAYFQSQAFAAGELGARFPPGLIDWLVPERLQDPFFRIARDTGTVASSYWPGFALLLVPFTMLDVPWLLNPIVGGATVLVMHRLAREIFADDESVGLVVLFTLASTAVTLNAISFYSMPAHLLSSALFLLLLIRPSPGRALLAGLVGSLALVLHNPVPHLLFALPWIVWLATRSDRLRVLAALAAGYAPLCLALGLGWALYLQDLARAVPVVAPAAPLNEVQSAIQSFARLLRPPSGGIVESRIIGLGKLWLWAAPGMVALAAMGAWRCRNDKGWWLVLGASALLTYFGYFFVPLDQGHGWGFRYFHSAWLVLPLFAVHALQPAEVYAPAATGRLRGYVAACALLGLAVMTTVQGAQIERFVSRHLAQLPAREGAGPRVVFIEPAAGYYSEDLVQNDPFLREPVIIFVSRGREQDEGMMRERFPSYELLSSDARGSVWGAPENRAGGRPKGRIRNTK